VSVGQWLSTGERLRATWMGKPSGREAKLVVLYSPPGYPRGNAMWEMIGYFCYAIGIVACLGFIAWTLDDMN
jgi:hypothetical protein